MEEIVENISISELVQIEKLSIRTLNVCHGSKLYDIQSILNYYDEYGDFLRLKWCGLKSNKELINICKKYRKCTSVDIHNQSNPSENGSTTINRKQKEIINLYVRNLRGKLSPKALSYINQEYQLFYPDPKGRKLKNQSFPSGIKGKEDRFFRCVK